MKRIKKRLILLATMSVLFISIAVLSNHYMVGKEEENILTTATPVSGKVVILDAGHRDSG